jgi:hypothetical protein
MTLPCSLPEISTAIVYRHLLALAPILLVSVQ